MNELLKKDITIKIISVVFAVLLWFLVLDSVNPSQTISLNVPLEVKNEISLQEKGLALRTKNYPRNVVVTVKGRKDRIASIISGDISAVLDFSKVKDNSARELSIDVYSSKPDISLEDWTPRILKFDFEKVEQDPFVVVIEPKGKLKENYKIVEMTAAPNTVSIQGFDSVIKSVGSVKAYIDVSNLNKDLVIKTDCKVYNKNGQGMPELEKGLNVEVKLKVAKEVPIVPIIEGKPARNYINGEKKVKPEKALITGAPEILDNINSLLTEPIDVENASQSIDTKAALKLPEGVKLYNTTAQVAVNIAIEQLATKDFDVKKEEIKILHTEIDNSLKYEIQSQVLTISVKGNKADLEQLDITRLNPSINVEKLGEGTHKLPLDLVLPNNVKLEEEYFVEVKIEKR